MRFVVHVCRERLRLPACAPPSPPAPAAGGAQTAFLGFRAPREKSPFSLTVFSSSGSGSALVYASHLPSLETENTPTPPLSLVRGSDSPPFARIRNRSSLPNRVELK